MMKKLQNAIEEKDYDFEKFNTLSGTLGFYLYPSSREELESMREFLESIEGLVVRQTDYDYYRTRIMVYEENWDENLNGLISEKEVM